MTILIALLTLAAIAAAVCIAQQGIAPCLRWVAAVLWSTSYAYEDARQAFTNTFSKYYRETMERA
jgi:hypothetical protein